MASIVYAMETLQVFRENSVVTVTINQPEKKNAINSAMWDGLAEIFREIASRADDRVVVVTGAGNDFCSGADLSGRGGNAAAGGAGAGAQAPQGGGGAPGTAAAGAGGPSAGNPPRLSAHRCVPDGRSAGAASACGGFFRQALDVGGDARDHGPEPGDQVQRRRQVGRFLELEAEARAVPRARHGRGGLQLVPEPVQRVEVAAVARRLLDAPAFVGVGGPFRGRDQRNSRHRRGSSF